MYGGEGKGAVRHCEVVRVDVLLAFEVKSWHGGVVIDHIRECGGCQEAGISREGYS